MTDQETRTEKPVFKLTLGFVVGWAWGLFAGIGGLGMALMQDTPAGVLVMLSSLIALPPFIALVRDRAGISFSGWLRAALAVGLVIAASARLESLGIHASSSTSQQETADTSDAPDSTKVSAIQLAQAFQANEVAAQGAYGDKTLDVSGVVVGVVLDLFNDPVVRLQGVNEFLPVQAEFGGDARQQLAALSKGQEVTVRCKSLTSVISAPMLNNCVLLETPDANGAQANGVEQPQQPASAANPSAETSPSAPPPQEAESGSSSQNAQASSSTPEDPKVKELFSRPEAVKFSPEFRQCLNAPGVLNDLPALTACTATELKTQNDAINATYTRVIGSLSPESQTQLREDERAWIKARDAKCGQTNNLPPDQVPGMQSLCAVTETAARTIALEKMQAGAGR